jgi:glycosyltransferase involved in cell wall biosynthesis
VRVLVVHQNFPGQFGHLVKAWAERPGWDLRGLGRETAPGLAGFGALARYSLTRPGHRQQHPYLRKMETAILHGQATTRAMLQMKRAGFTPDVILAHPGWGETLFAKDVYPDARLIHFCEWYYGASGADAGFDPEFPSTIDDHARIRTWNALHALNLTHCDAAVTPTQWQRSRHPEAFRHKIAVQHEGIDVDRLGPDARAAVMTPAGTLLRAGDPVVTYVARNLEPYRGFHVFLRALEKIQRLNVNAHAVIVGGDGVSYGAAPRDARTWRERLLREVTLDPSRTHFLGRVPYDSYVRVLQTSAVHVYLTYPFVLSWSMLEAMACGALVVGSDTAPVREVLRDGENGLLAPFFDLDAIARRVCAALEQPACFGAMRSRARLTAQAFRRDDGVAGYDALLQAGSSPPMHEPLSANQLLQ